MKQEASSRFSLFAYLIIALTVMIAYYPSLQNDYGFNDNYIFNDVTEQGISAVYEIFNSPYRQAENLSYGYRPIVSLSVALEISLFGKNPAVSHGINILIYLFICWLLFYLAVILFPDVNEKFWLAGVLLFSVLAIHTDVVCNIKSRDELLACLFALKGIVFAKKYLDQSKWYFLILVSICFLLAAWSKPTFVFYIFFGLMFLLVSQKPQIKKVITIGSFILLGGFVAKIIQRIVIESLLKDTPFIQFPLKDTNIIERIPTAIYSFGKYVELMFMPSKLSFYYGYNQVPITFAEAQSHFIFYIGIIVFLLMPLLLLYFYKNNRIVFLGLTILFFGLLLFSNLVKPGPGLIAERYFLGPSISVLFIVGGFLFGIDKSNAKNRKGFSYALFFMLIVSFVFHFQKTFVRNFDWKNKLTLFKSDIAELPNSAKANLLLADEMMFQNRLSKTKRYSFEKISSYYKRSLEIYPKYSVAWNNYAFACLYFGKVDEAKSKIDQSLALERSPKSLSNLANYYNLKKDTDKEQTILQEILSLDGGNVNVHKSTYTKLHNILIEINQYLLAERYALQSIEKFPKSSIFRDHLAKSYFAQEKVNQAIIEWKNAYQLNPESKVMPYKISKAYESINELDSMNLYKRIYVEK